MRQFLQNDAKVHIGILKLRNYLPVPDEELEQKRIPLTPTLWAN